MRKLAILGFCFILIAVVQPTFADEIQKVVISRTIAQIHKNALGDISVSTVYLKRHGIIYIILPDSEKGSKTNLIDFQLVRKFPIVATSYLWQFPKQSFLSEKEEVILVFNYINQVVVSLTNEILLKYQNGEIPFDKLFDSLTTVSIDLEEAKRSMLIRREATDFLVEKGKGKMNEYNPNERTWLGAYPKDKPEYLNGAVPYFDRALRLYPKNKEAPHYKEEISKLLLTRSLFNEAKTIYDQFKSDINSEDLNKKNKAIFSLYQAYDTLKKATKLNPEHKRANELFEKLSRLLETEPRPKRIEEPKTEKVAKEGEKKAEEKKVIRPKELIKTYTEPEGEKPAVSPKPTVEQEKVMPEYSVLNEELYDAPVKTQVTLNVLVSGEISEPGLRALLNQLYSSVKARRGFKYHDSPTNIYIYAFTSKERAESGMGQWIAMLRKSYGDVKPTISINERQIAQLGAKPEEQFGLSEEKRKEIWQELVLAEDRAIEEAEQTYPLDPTQSLQVGQVFQLSKETSLMPELHPVDPLAAMQKIKRLPPRTTIKVLRVAMKEQSHWYFVEAISLSESSLGSGWINSGALMGQAQVDFEQQLEKQLELENRLIAKYKDELGEKFGLTREQLKQISVEAHEKDWPFPK